MNRHLNLLLRHAAFATSVLLATYASLLPRETVNPINTGVWPQVLGVEWVTSPNVPFTDPLLVDREKLGGIATENIVSPEYSRAGDYELASERLQGRDQVAVGPFGGGPIRRGTGRGHGVHQFGQRRGEGRGPGPDGPRLPGPAGARGQRAQQPAIGLAEAVLGPFGLRRGHQENTTVRFL